MRPPTFRTSGARALRGVAFVAKRVLVLAPHPDDEVFGCGGALADLLDRGARVDVLLVTDGAAGARTRRSAGGSRRGRRRSRAGRSRRSAEGRARGRPSRPRLGGRLEDVEALLARWLVEAAPDLVFAPSPVETHPDHRAVAAALFGSRRVPPETPPRGAGARESRVLRAFPALPAELSLGYHARPRPKGARDGGFRLPGAERDYAGFVRGLNAYRRMTLSADVAAAEAYSVAAGSRLRSDPRGVVRDSSSGRGRRRGIMASGTGDIWPVPGQGLCICPGDGERKLVRESQNGHFLFDSTRPATRRVRRALRGSPRGPSGGASAAGQRRRAWRRRRSWRRRPGGGGSHARRLALLEPFRRRYHGGGYHGGGWHGGGYYYGGHYYVRLGLPLLGLGLGLGAGRPTPRGGGAAARASTSSAETATATETAVDVAARTGRYAVVKTDVSPEEAQVFLDGKYIGSADDFDGMPDFLYLGPGQYHLEFSLPNYQTYATELDVTRGQQVQLDEKLKLEQGKSALDQFPPVARARRSAASSRRVPRTGEAAPPPARGGRRAATTAGATATAPPPRSATRRGAWTSASSRLPRPRNRARMRFKVTPDDAAVYVDDKYLGAGEDLAANPRGVVADPARTRSPSRAPASRARPWSHRAHRRAGGRRRRAREIAERSFLRTERWPGVEPGLFLLSAPIPAIL